MRAVRSSESGREIPIHPPTGSNDLHRTAHHPGLGARSQMTVSWHKPLPPSPAVARTGAPLQPPPTPKPTSSFGGLLLPQPCVPPVSRGHAVHLFVLIFERARSRRGREVWAPRTRAQTRADSPCASDLLRLAVIQGHAALRLASSGRLVLLLHDAVDADADQCGNDRRGANCVRGRTRAAQAQQVARLRGCGRRASGLDRKGRFAHPRRR